MGDTITHVSGSAMNEVDDVQLAISLVPPGSATTVGYRRNNHAATANLVTSKLGPVGENIVTKPREMWRGMQVDFATALNSTELTQALNAGLLDPQGCVLISEVQDGSEAWKAGVRRGMFVSHVGGQRVTTPDEFYAAAKRMGDKFDVRLTQPADKPSDRALEPNKEN
jgi:S1-C subfamily serine protease